MHAVSQDAEEGRGDFLNAEDEFFVRAIDRKEFSRPFTEKLEGVVVAFTDERFVEDGGAFCLGRGEESDGFSGVVNNPVSVPSEFFDYFFQ